MHTPRRRQRIRIASQGNGEGPAPSTPSGSPSPILWGRITAPQSSPACGGGGPRSGGGGGGKSASAIRARHVRLSLLSILACAGLAACLVGPNYRRPSAPTPGAYKEAQGWAPAHPSDAADRRDWWTVFGDPTLNELETRVETSNQTLAGAEAA